MDNPFVGKFTIGQTLDRGIRLYKKCFKTVFLLLALPFALGMFNMKHVLMPDPSNPYAAFNLLYFLSMAAGFWSWIVIVRYVHSVSIGEKPDFAAIIRLARWSDLLFIITAIIWYVALAISLVALVIPFIYFLNISVVGVIIVIVERNYFLGGIGRTFSLTRGRWWKTLVINIVTLLIIIIPLGISMALFMGPLMKSSMESLTTTGTPVTTMPLSSIIGMVIYMIVAALITPLFTTINVVHYNSLKSDKENVDLSQQLDTLGGPAEQSQ
jgi:hypothetical protein